MNMRYVSLSILTLLMACSQQLTPTGRPADMDDPILTVWQQQRQPNAAPPFFNQPAPSVAQTGYLANPNVQAFIRYQHQTNGLDMQYLQDFFSRVGYRGNIIPIMNRPGTSRPWYEFRTGNAGSQKISGGRRFYQTHRAVIDQAAARYGVPAPLIVAILGIETNYGANKGIAGHAGVRLSAPRRAVPKRIGRIFAPGTGRKTRPDGLCRQLCRRDGAAAVHAVQLPQMGGGFRRRRTARYLEQHSRYRRFGGQLYETARLADGRQDACPCTGGRIAQNSGAGG